MDGENTRLKNIFRDKALGREHPNAALVAGVYTLAHMQDTLRQTREKRVDSSLWRAPAPPKGKAKLTQDETFGENSLTRLVNVLNARKNCAKITITPLFPT